MEIEGGGRSDSLRVKVMGGSGVLGGWSGGGRVGVVLSAQSRTVWSFFSGLSGAFVSKSLKQPPARGAHVRVERHRREDEAANGSLDT